MKLQNKTIRLSITILILQVSLAGFAFERPNIKDTDQHDSLYFLLIGNSFSKNATQYLQELATEAGYPLHIECAYMGGASMKKHWDRLELSEDDPENPDGRPYDGKTLRELLSSQKWEIISIQQVSFLSGNIDTYRPYARKLFDLAEEIQPEARIVMLQTWSYRTDSKDFSQISGGENAASSEEMWEHSRNAYQTIASELNIQLVPVGDAFRKVSTSKKWSYRSELPFDEQNATYPDLPDQKNSLHNGYYWDDDKELHFDSHHANEAGRYLGSLVWYAFLYQEAPRKLNYIPEDVPEDFARYLKRTAWKTIKD